MMEEGPDEERRLRGWADLWEGTGHSLPTHFSPAHTTLPSLVILPAPEEPLHRPAGSLAIRSLKAQSLRCLQPFHTQDTRGQPFHAEAHEALNVLLRHPSGGAGWESRNLPFCPRVPSQTPGLNPRPPLVHRLVAGGE